MKKAFKIIITFNILHRLGLLAKLDKASDYESGDCRFKSCIAQNFVSFTDAIYFFAFCVKLFLYSS